MPLNRFEEALAVYTGTRAIHELLEGSNFEVVRFFGGLVPFPLRSVLLSPPVADPRPRVWRFEELPADADVLRVGAEGCRRWSVTSAGRRWRRRWPRCGRHIGGALDADGFAETLVDGSRHRRDRAGS